MASCGSSSTNDDANNNDPMRLLPLNARLCTLERITHVKLYSPTRPLPPNARMCMSKRIVHVKLFRPKPHGWTLPVVKQYHTAFAALHQYQVHWIALTSDVASQALLVRLDGAGAWLCLTPVLYCTCAAKCSGLP